MGVRGPCIALENGMQLSGERKSCSAKQLGTDLLMLSCLFLLHQAVS